MRVKQSIAASALLLCLLCSFIQRAQAADDYGLPAPSGAPSGLRAPAGASSTPVGGGDALPAPSGATEAVPVTTATTVAIKSAPDANAQDDAEPSGAPARPGLYTIAGRFHPMVVHFPIALILAAALGEFVNLLRRKPFWRQFAQACLGLGALGGVVAATLGWASAATQDIQAHGTLELHRWMGIAVPLLAACAWLAGYRALRSGRRGWEVAYILLLFACAGIVGFTGHLGGELVYGADYLFG